MSKRGKEYKLADLVWVAVSSNDVYELQNIKIVQIDANVLFDYNDGNLYTEEVEEAAKKSYPLKELIDNMEFRN